MKYIGNVQAEANAEVFAVASGALPDGKPVVVNSNGTVSVVTGTSSSQASYSQTTLTNQEYPSYVFSVIYSPDDDKVVVLYNGTSGYPTAVVGTISGTSISFGTPVVVISRTVYYSDAAYDTSANKVILCVGSDGYPRYGEAYAVTISGTNLSLGAAFRFKTSASNAISDIRAVFDSSTNRTIVTYINPQYSSYLRVTALTCSGSTISAAIDPESVSTGTASSNSLVFDSDQNVVMSIWYQSNLMRYRAYTTSGTGFSFGSEVTDNTTTSPHTGVAYDPNTQKHLVVLRDSSSPHYAVLLPVTLSGTAVTIGTSSSGPAVVATNNRTKTLVPYYDSAAQKVTVLQSNASTVVYSVDMSGSSPVAGTSLATGYASSDQSGAAFVSSQNRAVLGLTGKASLYQNAYITTNLTSENFLGFTGGEVSPQVLTSAVFEAASINEGNAVYDSNSDKVVIVYRDGGNSEKGTAIVGTVSGSSITFGTAVVFQAQTLSELSCAFDSNSNKVVIAYKHDSDSGKGKAIVGTVSGTDISFGSAAEFEGGALKSGTSTTFDSSNNKIIIAYLDDDDGDKGKVVVATVSGTSISFGTPVVFNDATTREPNVTFDSNSNKVVVAFQDHGNSSQGTAVVGTVSGTGISFGSETIFNAASTEYPRLTFDSSNNKVLVFFKDSADSNKGKVIVGTVSGTGISFGTEVDTGAEIGSNDLRIAFNTSTNKAVIAYRNTDNSSYGTLQLGTVSGTSISLESAIVFNSASSNVYSVVFDPDTNQTVIVYRNGGNSNYGTSSIFVPELRPELADGKTATIQVGGSINTQQNALTAGQQYFVQADGTIGLTAASPSVIAGTAVSATDLIVKG